MYKGGMAWEKMCRGWGIAGAPNSPCLQYRTHVPEKYAASVPGRIPTDVGICPDSPRSPGPGYQLSRLSESIHRNLQKVPAGYDHHDQSYYCTWGIPGKSPNRASEDSEPGDHRRRTRIVPRRHLSLVGGAMVPVSEGALQKYLHTISPTSPAMYHRYIRRSSF